MACCNNYNQYSGCCGGKPIHDDRFHPCCGGRPINDTHFRNNDPPEVRNMGVMSDMHRKEKNFDCSCRCDERSNDCLCKCHHERCGRYQDSVSPLFNGWSCPLPR